jgi:hypothetical protein
MSTVGGEQHEEGYARAFARAIKPALTAGGTVIWNEIRRSLRGGYLSSLGNKGQFVTGASLTHCTLSPPQLVNGKWMVSVGTDLRYNLYWEVGHHNLFTRHYERDEKWSPAFRRVHAQALATFRTVMDRELRKGGR